MNFGSDSYLLYRPLKVVKQRNDWERGWPCCTKEVNHPAAKAIYISKGSNPTKRGCHGAVALTWSSICSCIDFSHGRRCEWIYLENQTRGPVFYNCCPAGHFPEASNCSPRCNERTTVFLNVAECSCGSKQWPWLEFHTSFWNWTYYQSQWKIFFHGLSSEVQFLKTTVGKFWSTLST